MTDIALIAPVSQLHHIVDRPYQMMLPSFTYHKQYQRYYKYFGSNESTWLILDNGAFEGETLNDEALLKLACDYRASEVIAPDVMGDSKKSLKLLAHFMSHWRHPSRPR